MTPPPTGDAAAAAAAAPTSCQACATSAGGCASHKLVNGKTVAEWSHICMNVCGARCCQHIAWAIDTPKTREHFERMRYALMHPKVSFFKEDGDWYLCVMTGCSKVLSNNGCGIYETRPQICRDYEAGACEWPDGVDWPIHLQDDHDLQEYLDKRLNRTREGVPYSLHNRADLVVWEIEPPLDEEDFDCMRWAVLHTDIAFFREQSTWYMCIGSPQARATMDRRDIEIYLDSDEKLRAFWDRRTHRKRQKATAK